MIQINERIVLTVSRIFQSVALIDLLFAEHTNASLKLGISKAHPLGDDDALARARDTQTRLQPNSAGVSLEKVDSESQNVSKSLHVMLISGREAVPSRFNHYVIKRHPQLAPVRPATATTSRGCEEEPAAFTRPEHSCASRVASARNRDVIMLRR